MTDLLAKLDALAEKAQTEGREQGADIRAFRSALENAYPALRAELVAAREVCEIAELLAHNSCTGPHSIEVDERIMSNLDKAIDAYRAARTAGGGT